MQYSIIHKRMSSKGLDKIVEYVYRFRVAEYKELYNASIEWSFLELHIRSIIIKYDTPFTTSFCYPSECTGPPSGEYILFRNLM